MRTANYHYSRVSAILLAMVVAALLLGVLLVSDNPASAIGTKAVPGTTITVNSIGDGGAPGNCTLREAITAADTNAQVDECAAGSDTQRDAINFSLGPQATIVLGSQLPNITDDARLTINGRKAEITVSGNDSVRVFFVGSGAKLILANLTVADGRSSSSDGGGLYNQGGTVDVLSSTFSGNDAANGAGGGLINDDGTLNVFRSTISDNDACLGGGIFNDDGTLTVTNSTFSGNSACFNGGAIYQNSNLSPSSTSVSYSTISGNSADNAGGGIYNNGSHVVTVSSTIVARSPSGGNCSGTITDGGYNIDGGTTCGFSSANNSMPSTGPRLIQAGLQENGGPTKTIALKVSSPAIDAVAEGCPPPATDQRGVSRPQEGDGEGDALCDIGAFERQAP